MYISEEEIKQAILDIRNGLKELLEVMKPKTDEKELLKSDDTKETDTKPIRSSAKKKNKANRK